MEEQAPFAHEPVRFGDGKRVLKPYELDELVLVGGGSSTSYWLRYCYQQYVKMPIEVWCIGSIAFALRCDKVFDMHSAESIAGMDPYYQANLPGTVTHNAKIANLTNEYLKLGCDVVTTDGHDGTMEYPLAEVLEEFSSLAFTSGPAHAVALAIMCLSLSRKPRKNLYVFGFDYEYEHTPNVSMEAGAECVNMWLGRAQERDICVHVPDTSNLLGHKTIAMYGVYGYGYKLPQVEEHNGRARLTGFKDMRDMQRGTPINV